MVHWHEVTAFAGREVSVQDLVKHSMAVKRSRAKKSRPTPDAPRAAA